MNPRLKLLVRLVIVAVLGYLVIALLQTLTLEIVLEGRVHPDAPIWILAIGIMGTVLSGLIGGVLVATFGGPHPRLQVSAVLVPLALDAIYVVTVDSRGEPLGFSLGGVSTLMMATLAGGWLHTRRRDR